MRQSKVVTSVLLTIALLASACSTAEPSAVVVPKPDEAAGDSSGEVRTLTIGIPSEFPTLGWDWGYQAATGLVLNQIFEFLVDSHPVTGERIPGLATKWTNINALTWRFQIREGVVFHDGSILNAEAVAYSLNWILDSNNAFTAVNTVPVKFESVATDEYVLEIRTASPFPTLPVALGGLGIGSMEYHLKNPEMYESNPVGTGPYKFVKWTPGESYELERFDGWWGSNDPDYPGGSRDFDRVTFLIRPEAASRINAVLAGEADFAWGLPAAECNAALGDGCLSGPDPTQSFLRLDGPHPVLGDSRIREAIDYAIDREAIGVNLLGGAEPASQIISKGNPGFNQELKPTPYDPERARQLIAEAKTAGVPIDTPMQLWVRANAFPGSDRVLEAVGGYLADVGLPNFELGVMDTPIFNPPFTVRPAGVPVDRGLLAVHRWPDDAREGLRIIADTFLCESALATMCFPEVDEQVKRAQETFDEQERTLQIAAIMDLLFGSYEYKYVLPLHHLRIFHGMGEGIGYEPAPDLRLRVRMFNTTS